MVGALALVPAWHGIGPGTGGGGPRGGVKLL